MQKTLEQIRLLYAEIATAHEQIKRYYWGSLLDANKEDDSSDSEKNYALLVVQPLSANLSKSTVSINLILTICDKVYKDWSNLEEVQSDTLQIAKDIYDTMTSDKWLEFSSIEENAPLEPFIDRSVDEVTGWVLNLNLNITSMRNLCAIPFSSYDFEGVYVSPCEPVSIFEDGVLVEEVASGGSYSYSTACADGTANVNKSDGTLISAVTVPSGSTVGYNVADSTVKSTGVAYTSSVKATETFTIPDVSYTDSDSTVKTAEYGSAIVCTPASTPSGIKYNRPTFKGNRISDVTYDAAWYFNNGHFDWANDPTNPAQFATLDDTAYTTADEAQILEARMIENNMFSNKLRFTDEVGAAPNGTSAYILDHYTGLMFYFESDASDNFYGMITKAEALTNLGKSDWRVPLIEEAMSLPPQNASTTLGTLVSGAGFRTVASTTDPADATDYYYMQNWGVNAGIIAVRAKTNTGTVNFCAVRTLQSTDTFTP